jgi:hypothetical protein
MLVILFTLLICFSFCGCDEGTVRQDYSKIHINTLQYAGCIEIDKVITFQTTGNIKVKTKDFGICNFSSGSYIVIEDKCPICDKY